MLRYVSFHVSFLAEVKAVDMRLLIGIYLPLTGRRVFDWISSLNPAADDL